MEDAMKHNPLANVQRKGVEIPSEDVPSDTDDTQDKTK
jgi:hypothetical protein